MNDTNLSPSAASPVKKRIQRQSLHLEVADNLRDMIVEGALSPGQRISEGDEINLHPGGDYVESSTLWLDTVKPETLRL